MKIKKTLFSREIELSIEELNYLQIQSGNQNILKSIINLIDEINTKIKNI